MLQFVKFMHYSGDITLIRVDHILAITPCEGSAHCDVHLSTGAAVMVRGHIEHFLTLIEGLLGSTWDAVPEVPKEEA